MRVYCTQSVFYSTLIANDVKRQQGLRQIYEPETNALCFTADHRVRQRRSLPEVNTGFVIGHFYRIRIRDRPKSGEFCASAAALRQSEARLFVKQLRCDATRLCC